MNKKESQKWDGKKKLPELKKDLKNSYIGVCIVIIILMVLGAAVHYFGWY